MSPLRQIFALSRGYRRRMALSIALSSAVILSNVALLALSGWFISAMALAGLGALRLEFFTASSTIRGLAIARALGRYLERLVSHDVTLRMVSAVRVWFYTRLVPLAPAGLGELRQGDLLARMRSDIDSLETLFLSVLSPMAAAAISALAITLWMALQAPDGAPLVAAMNLAALVLAGLGVPLWVAHVTRTPGQVLAQRRAQMGAAMTDLTRGFSELVICGALPRQIAQVLARSQDSIAAQRRLAWRGALGQALSGGIGQLAVWVALVMLLPKTAPVPGAGLSPTAGPELVMLVFAVMASAESVAALPAAMATLASTRAAAARLMAIADRPDPSPDPTEPRAPQGHAIAFRHVSMRYGQEPPVLRDLSFEVAPGQMLAISGPSGVGKSTILALLQRFWRPEAGTIEIGGVALEDLSEARLRAMICVVDQHCYLFNGTIRDNLRLARPEAEDATLIRALEQAAFGPDLAALPAGLDSEVGEEGRRLSGGQRRRIALARAILRDAPILLLDEPTENLDLATEAAVIDALGPLSAGRTVILVSHRPQLLARADRHLILGR